MELLNLLIIISNCFNFYSDYLRRELLITQDKDTVSSRETNNSRVHEIGKSFYMSGLK